jgi:hypothetical protein
MGVAGAIASLATLAFLRLPIRGLRSTPEDTTAVADEASLISSVT